MNCERMKRLGLEFHMVPRSADFQSAVSQVFNLPPPRLHRRAGQSGGDQAIGWFPDCKSAIQQIANLRYGSGMLQTCIVLVMLLVSIGPATAQSELDVKKQITVMGQTKPIPVSISGFSGEVTEVIQFDLYVQGFSFTNAESAQYLLSGSNNGNVQGRAVDNLSKTTLISKSYTGASLRRQAHAFVDDFVQTPVLGRKGIAQTKIAFKGEAGGNSEIYIA